MWGLASMYIYIYILCGSSCVLYRASQNRITLRFYGRKKKRKKRNNQTGSSFSSCLKHKSSRLNSHNSVGNYELLIWQTFVRVLDFSLRDRRPRSMSVTSRNSSRKAVTYSTWSLDRYFKVPSFRLRFLELRPSAWYYKTRDWSDNLETKARASCKLNL